MSKGFKNFGAKKGELPLLSPAGIPIIGAPPPPQPGTIGILTAEDGRYSRFWLAMMDLHLPPGVRLITKFSLNIAQARNEILRDAHGEWVWFMDDDHTFAPDTLKRLLARGVDLIQPLVLTRYAPFSPVYMGPKDPKSSGHWRYALEDGETGLKPVHIIGCGGMLVRRRVWETLSPPWFTNSGTDVDVVSEDIAFCNRAREAGFQPYVDLETPMGHINVGEVWPDRLPDGKWATRIAFGNASITVGKAKGLHKVDAETGEPVE